MKWNEMKWNEMKWNEMKWNVNNTVIHTGVYSYLLRRSRRRKSRDPKGRQWLFQKISKKKHNVSPLLSLV